MTDSQLQEKSRKAEIDSLLVIGSFLGIFAIAVLVAIFFTTTSHGKVTNLICGLLLLAISLFTVINSLKKKRRNATGL